MKTSLTIIAYTTKSFNVLMAIKQIKLGLLNAPLVLEFFPNGYDDDLSIKSLDRCLKILNDKKNESRKSA